MNSDEILQMILGRCLVLKEGTVESSRFLTQQHIKCTDPSIKAINRLAEGMYDFITEQLKSNSILSNTDLPDIEKETS